MKIFCVGKNYLEHAKEMNSKLPEEPLIFMKPPSALLLENKAFYYPEFSKEIHYEAEIVLKIAKNGKYVQPEYAESYIDSIAFGIDFTARDLQRKCKKNGFPWEIAKAFDQSAALSRHIKLPVNYREGIDFSLHLNDKEVQHGHTGDMIYSFSEIICYISKFFKVQTGDLIYTGTPAGVGQVSIGDELKGYIADKYLLSCAIK